MDPNEFVKVADQSGQIPGMVSEVARRKGLAAVLEKARVKDASGTVVDLQALFVSDEADGDDGIQVISPEEARAGIEEAAPAPSAVDPTAITVSDIGGFEPAEDTKS